MELAILLCALWSSFGEIKAELLSVRRVSTITARIYSENATEKCGLNVQFFQLLGVAIRVLE